MQYEENKAHSKPSAAVMAGLVPTIHVFVAKKQDVDARDKRGHDERAPFIAINKGPGRNRGPIDEEEEA